MRRSRWGYHWLFDSRIFQAAFEPGYIDIVVRGNQLQRPYSYPEDALAMETIHCLTSHTTLDFFQYALVQRFARVADFDEGSKISLGVMAARPFKALSKASP